MPRSHDQYLEDIVEAIRRIQEYVADHDWTDFMGDTMLRDAIERNLIVVGEAAAKLPEDLLRLEPAIDWSLVVGMRNIVVHEYFGIDYRIVWDVVSNELVPVVEAARRLLASLN